MCKLCRKPDTEPLSQEEAQEMRDEGLSRLLVELEGQVYNDEDLYHCDNVVRCGFKTVSVHDLDSEGLCEGCAESAKEWAEADRQMRSDYYASQL